MSPLRHPGAGGIHFALAAKTKWIPAFAGMTEGDAGALNARSIGGRRWVPAFAGTTGS
jgi:hypothetical protein